MTSFSSSGSGRVDKQPPLWQDRDIRFDITARELGCRAGEQKLQTFHFVEDTKGNAGDYGRLQISNLRITWQSRSKPKINLTIGLNCVCAISKKQLHSELRGAYSSLHLMCKAQGTRYEFIFSQISGPSGHPVSLDGQPDDLIYWLTAICRAYGESRFFRDLRLRVTLFQGASRQLRLLPDERIYRRVQGVWNLSADQGNLGTMHLTDVRIVWAANLNELFNLSLPYVQVIAVRVRESKFGLALVIESSELSGGYVLGFKLDPPERLHALHAELVNLFNVHSNKPTFGVERLISKDHLQRLTETGMLGTGGGEDGADSFKPMAEETGDSFVDSSTQQQQSPDVIAAYLADEEQPLPGSGALGSSGSGAGAAGSVVQGVVYCPELGLSIERIKQGYTLEELWTT